MSHGPVCSQRSRKYPIAPPSTIAPTKVNGSSRATADWEAKSCGFLSGGDSGGFSSGLKSEGIVRELRERLRIQPRGEGNKYSHTERHGLRIAHDRTRRFARLLEPGRHDDAE